jgi:hypothetical protein
MDAVELTLLLSSQFESDSLFVGNIGDGTFSTFNSIVECVTFGVFKWRNNAGDRFRRAPMALGVPTCVK